MRYLVDLTNLLNLVTPIFQPQQYCRIDVNLTKSASYLSFLIQVDIWEALEAMPPAQRGFRDLGPLPEIAREERLLQVSGPAFAAASGHLFSCYGQCSGAGTFWPETV